MKTCTTQFLISGRFLAVFLATYFGQASFCAAPPDGGLYVSKVWVADNGDGTYKNPILFADYSDPDVTKAGMNYYMTASSFTCLPGLPILHSKDLVNWTILTHAVQRYPDSAFELPQHGKGIWAPSIRYYNGMFYIIWGDPDNGIYRVRAQLAEGPWEDPLLILPGKGLIDPCPFWDEDGSAWLVHGWAGSRAGVKSLLTVRSMAPDASQVNPEGRHVFDGHEKHPTIEGPKFYKRNGYYYIFAPAGGVSGGWQTVLRSKDIYGPYEERVVLAQGPTPVNGPHQGGWIQTPDGRDWFIHFQDAGAYGRIIHLQPMTWTDDWPAMGVDPDGDGIGQPVLSWQKPEVQGRFPAMTPAESDEFEGDAPGLQWQWQANPNVLWFARIRGTGFLRLFAIALPSVQANLWQAPNLLLQKFPAPDFTATAKVRLVCEDQSVRGGLTVFGQDYACIELAGQEKKIRLRQLICQTAESGKPEKILQEMALDTDTIFLRVQVSSPDAQCRFSYSIDGGQFMPVGELFTAKPGKWVGAKVGLYCLSQAGSKAGGYLDADWFRIE